MDWKEEILEQTKKAKNISLKALNYTSAQKNRFLECLSANISKNEKKILSANKQDIEKAKINNCSSAFIDRLTLTEKRLSQILKGISVVKELTDPVGEKISETIRPNGIRIEKIRTPIGVIGIIYESRPDVTIEAGILCLKAGNSVVLRGGKEAKHSNKIFVSLMKKSLAEAGLSEDMVQLITSGGRKAVKYLLSLNRYIDLIIPRGGDSLIKAVVEESTIPVIKHYKGICHIYVDKDAEIDMAVNVCYNAKVQRPATCNAMETLLVHKDIADAFLPLMAKIFKEAQVEMRGCPETLKILRDINRAVEEDWFAEYLDRIISIKIVGSLDEAINHINNYGSMHSEAIITNNKEAVSKFFNDVDAAALFHNASTRFTDGGEFGMGAEIGISTDKIHARGPMGLADLTSYKYIIYGNGQTRQ
ncbi:MAG: glutamate-5-semialdehyde dehydrogenase [Elusimicrobia bacterium]|nr:glutamate-5-semialdehyde dehydrogenase [Elusimicrobiota bacterium]